MNLQIPVPYQPCVYHCPFCCARNNLHQTEFENLFALNRDEWRACLLDALEFCDTAVLTGDCDPTQDMEYVQAVITTIKESRPDVTIEFTTHNFNTKFLDDLRGCDVITFSITSMKDYLRAWKLPLAVGDRAQKTRMVVDLTEEFEVLNEQNFSSMGFNQVTFKVLQHSEDPEVNQWIDEHGYSKDKLETVTKIVAGLNAFGSCSARLDTTCQTGAGRYKIFRCNGNVYGEWNEGDE